MGIQEAADVSAIAPDPAVRRLLAALCLANGGELRLHDDDLVTLPADVTIQWQHDPATFDTVIRAVLPPETIDGDVVASDAADHA